MLDPNRDLIDLIQELCKSGSQILDASKLKEIKRICKTDDSFILIAYESLLEHLQKDHSEIRYSTLQIIDELFQRSHKFRELILDDLNLIFEFILETNLDNPLPPPLKKSIELKKFATKTIKCWYDKYHMDYKLLELGFNYLKNIKKIDFLNFSHQTQAQRNFNEKQNERQQILINKNFIEYSKEMNEMEIDINTCVEQFERSIKLLMPGEDLFDNYDFNLKTKHILQNMESNENELEKESEEDATLSDDDDSEDDFVEVNVKKSKEEIESERNEEMKYLGILKDGTSLRMNGKETSGQMNIDINLNEDEDNKIVFEIIRGLYKELKNSYLTKINNWIKNFSSAANGTTHLNKALQIKNKVKGSIKKFDDLNIPLNIYEREQTRTQHCTSKSTEILSAENSENETKEIKNKNKKLLKIAPIINLEEFEFLGASSLAIETENGLYHHKDNKLDNGLASDNFSTLTKKPFIGNFEPVKWKCRAPLKSGKLCPRMDRIKCPIHGRVVARDDKGNVVKECDKYDPSFKNQINLENESAVLPWQDAELIADINANTGAKIEAIGLEKPKRGTKRKASNLTDLSKEGDSPRKRIEKKIFTTKSLSKVGSILDSIEMKHNHDKFHHNFNYSIQS